MIGQDLYSIGARARSSAEPVDVLRRLLVPDGPTGIGGDLAADCVGVVVDFEPTGLDRATADITELAIRRFRNDSEEGILEIGRARSWREDPARPLDPAIARLTDADLAGQAIDDVAATALLRSASVVVPHKAGFDRKVVERRLPDAARLAWACSCNKIDWPAAGFDTRRLGWLFVQAGYFLGAHRVDADVNAVLKLLGFAMPDGRTSLRGLLDTAGAPSIVIKATGAGFDVKAALKERGYRCNPATPVWSREVDATSLTDEEFWLTANVDRPERQPKAGGPTIAPITWFERHA